MSPEDIPESRDGKSIEVNQLSLTSSSQHKLFILPLIHDKHELKQFCNFDAEPNA